MFAFRSIGPSLTTGRISDIAIDPKNPSVWYVAASSGNLWKTENRGNTWTPIFETYGSYSLGRRRRSEGLERRLARNRREQQPAQRQLRRRHLQVHRRGQDLEADGARELRAHQNILIDPRNSNVVYVSAIGPLWSVGRRPRPLQDDRRRTDVEGGPHDQSGHRRHRRRDGSEASRHALRRAYQRRRHVGQLIGGGPESGLYKTTDGGAKWTKLTKGLPTVEIGRIGLGINWRNPNTVYALVTAQRGQGGFFRSDDAGASVDADRPHGRRRTGRRAWRRGPPPPQPPPACSRSAQGPCRLHSRRRDNRDAPPEGGRGGASDDCYRGGDPRLLQRDHRRRQRSRDDLVAADADVPQHGRRQDLGASAAAGRARRSPRDRLRSRDPRHYIIGNDGGVYETLRQLRRRSGTSRTCRSRSSTGSTPTTRGRSIVCGGAQDNGTICGPSRTLNRGGIRTSDWFTVGGGDGFQARVDPTDPNVVYTQSQNGSLSRLDLRTGQSVGIRPSRQNTAACRRGSRGRPGRRVADAAAAAAVAASAAGTGIRR